MNTDATKVVENMPLTKAYQQELVNKLVANVQEGEQDPLEILIRLSFLQGAVENAITVIRPQALNEAEKYSQKTFGKLGAQVQIKETGVKYDFTADKEWCEINEQLKGIKAVLKGRETTLKAMKLFGKSSTTSVSITFPNE